MTDKGRILAFPDTSAIEAEAAAWVARFDAGDVSAKDQADFQDWLNRSALHRDAIAEFGNLWSEMDGLAGLTGSGHVAQNVGVRENHPRRLVRAASWLAACAASVIAVAGGAVLLQPRPHDAAKIEAHIPDSFVAETAIGHQKRIALADGTKVILNTNSRLAVHFTGARRDVHLLRGEAYFEVVHNKARPFTVYANNYVVRDIGTAFDVHLSSKGLVEVGVTKGCVEVGPSNGARDFIPAKGVGVIRAGHNIVLGEKIEVPTPVSIPDMGRKLAWRQGELIYTGQPLHEVLADVSRYSDIKIDLADPALADLPVGGAFRTDQIGAIFAALENNFGIRAEWIDAQHVRFTGGGEKILSKD